MGMEDGSEGQCVLIGGTYLLNSPGEGPEEVVPGLELASQEIRCICKNMQSAHMECGPLTEPENTWPWFHHEH